MKRVVVVVVAVLLLGLGIVLARAVMQSSGARAFPAEVASNFWASWCDPCKDEAPILQDLWITEAQPQGVAFVGIDTQDLRDDARAFAVTYGLTYPLVHDVGGAVGRDWGVGAFPETFIIDPQGRAVAWFPGEVTADGLRDAIAMAKASS